jgi:hypothetical protein
VRGAGRAGRARRVPQARPRRAQVFGAGAVTERKAHSKVRPRKIVFRRV